MKLCLSLLCLLCTYIFPQSPTQNNNFHLKVSILDHYYYNISPSQNDELFCTIDTIYEGGVFFSKNDTVIVHLNDGQVDTYPDGEHFKIRFEQTSISQIALRVCKGFDADTCWTMKHKYISISTKQLKK